MPITRSQLDDQISQLLAPVSENGNFDLAAKHFFSLVKIEIERAGNDTGVFINDNLDRSGFRIGGYCIFDMVLDSNDPEFSIEADTNVFINGIKGSSGDLFFLNSAFARGYILLIRIAENEYTVLSANSAAASGGQVNTVVGGDDITVDATDPVNPIVNLDASITAIVNSVTLTAAGAATNFLNEAGAYSVPAGGGAFSGALVQQIGSQSIPNGANTTVTGYTTEVYDTDAFHDNATNPERLTIPTGVTKVQAIAGILWASNATGERTIIITKNAGTDQVKVTVQPSNSFEQQVITPVIEVVATDFLTVEVFQDTGGALNILGSAIEAAYFGIEVKE